MNPAASKSTTSEPTAEDRDLCAVLVLDSGGRVVAVNRSAGMLWGTPEKSLVGVPFPDLLAQSPANGDRQPANDQWKALGATALDRWVACELQPHHGAPRPVRLRLERGYGGAGSYIAALQLA